MAAAVVAWAQYGQGYEPDGWERHYPSNRYRPGSVKAAEYIKDDYA